MITGESLTPLETDLTRTMMDHVQSGNYKVGGNPLSRMFARRHARKLASELTSALIDRPAPEALTTFTLDDEKDIEFVAQVSRVALETEASRPALDNPRREEIRQHKLMAVGQLGQALSSR